MALSWQTRFARTDGIEIRPVPDGFVVYDPTHDRVHYLNPTAALLLESCDGAVAANELPALLASAFALPEPPTLEVEACLNQLLAEGLLRPA